MPTKTKPTAPTEPASSPPIKAPNKLTVVLKLLTRARGATAAELSEPTGWQPHSVRAYLSGLRKRGRTIVRERRKTGEAVYRIVEAASPPTVAAAESAGVTDAAQVDVEIEVDTTAVTTPASV